jgi:hypothetical protein
VLTEDSIKRTLEGVIDDIRQEHLDAAQARLDDLGFERLLKPIPDASRGRRLFTDPAAPFGVERVHRTGGHLGQCRAALRRGNGKGALQAAISALQRWQYGRPEQPAK